MRRVLSVFALLLASISVAKASPWEPLSDADETRYRKIFTAQEKGDWQSADALIAKLENKVLLGYVLEQRYMHPTAYRSSYPELRRWLAAYADHPNAAPVYRLARKRQSGAAPRRPSGRPWRSPPPLPLHPQLEEDYATSNFPSDVRRIESRLRYLTREGRATQALNYLMAPQQFNKLTAAQTDRARGWVAAAYYYEGELSKAQEIAEAATKRSSEVAVLSHWIEGLIAWRRDDYETAYTHFSKQADVPYQEDTMRAGAAFWAARAALATGRTADVTEYLGLASSYPFTMYGQLALGQLGLDPDIEWRIYPPTDEDLERISEKTPRLTRALALAQVGQKTAAEHELQWAQGELSAEEDASLLAFARAADLPSAELLIALQGQGDREDFAHLRSGLFPVPDYEPTGGFTIDRAILFGLIRQESKFMTEATSSVGARGLMQLMPRTASYVSNNTGLATGHSSSKLYEPEYNMQLGQSYVEQLLTRYNNGEGDLFEMALSYNWGPGSYNRWQSRTGIEDPLLMIESVPNQQARHFVETVITNMWVYRDRFGEPAPSRDALSAGERPIYQAVSTR
ncbi:lytic transglycosylase domain-containing protein [Parvularcula marina]|nr:lytic transglycosylase domain-containing protein [Parvularcula marina]